MPPNRAARAPSRMASRRPCTRGPQPGPSGGRSTVQVAPARAPCTPGPPPTTDGSRCGRLRRAANERGCVKTDPTRFYRVNLSHVDAISGDISLPNRVLAFLRGGRNALSHNLGLERSDDSVRTWWHPTGRSCCRRSSTTPVDRRADTCKPCRSRTRERARIGALSGSSQS
jgi:hypothetical protein